MYFCLLAETVSLAHLVDKSMDKSPFDHDYDLEYLKIISCKYLFINLVLCLKSRVVGALQFFLVELFNFLSMSKQQQIHLLFHLRLQLIISSNFNQIMSKCLRLLPYQGFHAKYCYDPS